jgi:hypothetical protein
MIRGPKFRGISYKCGVSHFSEKQWSRAIREFESIPLYLEDEAICEMLGTCYLNLQQVGKAKELYTVAAEIYREMQEKEKENRLRDKIANI